jgi:hypothetical protein
MSYSKEKIQEILIKTENDNHSFEDIVALAGLNNSKYQYILATFFETGYYVDKNIDEAKY